MTARIFHALVTLAAFCAVGTVIGLAVAGGGR